jgi:CheY-like chemotaxis protein
VVRVRNNESAITVVVVDDEESLVRIIAAVLRERGFHTLEVSPLEAVRVVENATNEIRLVLSDFYMAGMSGIELASRLRDIEPAIGVIFMTGNYAAREDLIAQGFVCLQKPFSFADLSSLTQQVLSLRQTMDVV